MEFREFNVGDVVTVVNEPYEDCPFTWVDQMTNMCGRMATITGKCYSEQYGTYRYNIKEDDGSCFWCGNCFFLLDRPSLHYFRVGDRVCASVNSPDYNDSIHIGDTGTVCAVDENETRIGVKWDHNVCGHDCNGMCEYGFGWWVDNISIELVVDELSDIDITDDSLLRVLGGGI